MDLRLKPLIDPKQPKRSYKSKDILNLTKIKTDLLILLSNLKNYLTHNPFQPKLDTLHEIRDSGLKKAIHEKLDCLIRNHVNHCMKDKLEGCLNSLEKELMPEAEQKSLVDFYQKVKDEILVSLHSILEILHMSSEYKEVASLDVSATEAKGKNLLYFILYNIYAWKQHPSRILSKYCSVNYDTLLMLLMKETDRLSQKDLMRGLEFSVGQFEEGYVEGSQEIANTCKMLLEGNGIDMKSQSTHDLLSHVRKSIEEIISPEFLHQHKHALSDTNIKIDHLAEIDVEEMKDIIRKALDGLLRGQLEQIVEPIFTSIDPAFHEATHAYEKIKGYFQTLETSEGYQKVVNGNYERDLREIHEYEYAGKALDAVKLCEDRLKETLSKLTELEEAYQKGCDVKSAIDDLSKREFETLVESAKGSATTKAPLSIFHGHMLLHSDHLLHGLKKLLEEVSVYPKAFLEKISLAVLREKLKLVAVKAAEHEHLIRDNKLNTESVQNILKKHSQSPTPFYVYSLTPSIVILQILDLSGRRYRIFAEEVHHLGIDDESLNVQKVHLHVGDDLNKVLDLLRAYHHLKARFHKEEHGHNEDVELRNLILSLALYNTDHKIDDNQELHELVLSKSLIHDFLSLQETERERKIPEEKKEETAEPSVEEAGQEAENKPDEGNDEGGVKEKEEEEQAEKKEEENQEKQEKAADHHHHHHHSEEQHEAKEEAPGEQEGQITEIVESKEEAEGEAHKAEENVEQEGEAIEVAPEGQNDSEKKNEEIEKGEAEEGEGEGGHNELEGFDETEVPEIGADLHRNEIEDQDS